MLSNFILIFVLLFLIFFLTFYIVSKILNNKKYTSENNEDSFRNENNPSTRWPVNRKLDFSIKQPPKSDTIRCCPYCDLKVPKGARKCWNCKNRLPANRSNVMRSVILGFVCLLIVIFALSSIASDPGASTSAPPAKTEYGIGDTQEHGGIIVTLKDVSESHGSQFFEPSSGCVFVTCELSIENNSGSDLVVSSLLSFECYFDSYLSNVSLGAMTEREGKQQLDGSIAPGKKLRGIVGFEAPKNWKEMEIRFNPNIYSSDTFVFNHRK